MGRSRVRATRLTAAAAAVAAVLGGQGWLSAPVRVSRAFGARAVWPGDTIGISVQRGPRVMLSWGSAVADQVSEIWAAGVTVTRRR